jgi:hypothetical protein
MTKLIDVRCTETGTWSVVPPDGDVPLSVHASETEAEQVAQAHATRLGARVMIHDRYERVHESPPITAARPDAGTVSAEPARVTSTPQRRHRWLLGLEPIFEGGWRHKGERARRWDVEPELAAVALFGDVTVDLAQARSTPDQIDLSAWAVLRDVDVTVPAGTRVEVAGDRVRSHLVNHVPAVPDQRPDRVVRVHGHTLLGDVTVRREGAPH